MTLPATDMSGKTIIITGAASGIGRASAEMFAKAGANVVACDLSDTLDDVASGIRAAGGAVTVMRMDAGAEADVAAAVELACDTYGGLDSFFANAGITGRPMDNMFEAEAKDWAEVLRVNLIGPFLAVKYGAPKMKERGAGSIVATASVAGIRANGGPAAYSASKAGVMNLVQVSANQLYGTNVRVNAICPGLIETGMTKNWYTLAKMSGTEKRLGQHNAMARGGAPSEIAAVALFLCSDLASYVNGQAIAVDGGLSSTHPFSLERRPTVAEVEKILASAKV